MQKISKETLSRKKSWWSDRALILLTILLGLLLTSFCLNLAMGSVRIPLAQILTILLGYQPAKATWSSIIFKFRLPQALTAALAGAALSVSGLQMQTLFANPLAGPFVLGINAGASLGVALVVLTVNNQGIFGDLGLTVAASLGSTLVLLLAIAVAQRVRNSTTLLIFGLMFGYATNAIVTIALHFSITEQIQSYLRWTFGSFGGVTWSQMPIFAPTILIGLALAYLLSKNLNLLLLGESQASSLGLNLQHSRFGIIVSAAMLAGTVTAFCGPIAFLGVAVPHLCRACFQTADHRVLLPATTLMGATLAISANLIARMPGSQVALPLNAVTALIGAPVVSWVILRQQRIDW
ncbi:MAG: iron ABC transporter permease [Hormoscilla sp. GM7CHS1pb]|nr:iron ABC transporter permease [Hormoscilla sp. GM7CHS1pb]